MASTFNSAPRASFKTAYLQREDVLIAPAAASIDARVGDVVKINANGKLEKVAVTGQSTAAAAIAAAKAAVQVGNYILAQSDMTMDYGHVPVENRDYRYSDKVSMIANEDKRVMVYKIVNLDDIVLTAEAVEIAG